MSQEFHAIYENGVLRPLAPLGLPEAAEVIGTFQLARPSDGKMQGVNPLLGVMSSDADTLDEVVEEAMQARECDPLRVSG